MSDRSNLMDHCSASGDMPVRVVPCLAFLVDGRTTMLEMCIAFLRARDTIYITAWGISPDLLLVRGKHRCAGSAGSPEQEELLSWLHAKGLSDEELNFWQRCEELSVTNVLAYAVDKGVDVRVLLWDTYPLPGQPNPDPKTVQEILESSGVHCLLDDSHNGILNHPLMAHHQKTSMVDGRLAFVGGVDVMVENDGDFDRWDTKGHLFQNPLRMGKDGKIPTVGMMFTFCLKVLLLGTSNAIFDKGGMQWSNYMKMIPRLYYLKPIHNSLKCQEIPGVLLVQEM